MLDTRFSQLYFGPSLNTLQLGLPAIAGLLVFSRFRRRVYIFLLMLVTYDGMLSDTDYTLQIDFSAR